MHGDEEDENRGGWFTTLGIVAATLIAMFLALSSLLGSSTLMQGIAAPEWTAEFWGTFIGHMTFSVPLISVGVWAVLHFTYVRWAAPYRTASYFLIILAAVLVTNIGGAMLIGRSAGTVHAHDEAVLREADAELDKAFSDDGGAPIDMRVEAKGEAGEIVRIAKTVAKSNRDAGAAYKMAIHALGYPDFLMPKRLAAPHGLADADARLVKGREAVKTYRLSLKANADAFRARIAAAKFDEAIKNTLLASFNSRMSTVGDLNARILACEDATFAEYEYALDDLKHAKGRWAASKTSMQFADQRDLDRWRDHMANINSLARDEREANNMFAAMNARR